MENLDLGMLQRAVQEAVRKADLATLAWDGIAAAVPARLDTIEQRIGALELRVTALERSQQDAVRRLVRIEAALASLADLDRRLAGAETLLGRIAAKLGA